MQTVRMIVHMRRKGADYVVLHVVRSLWNHLKSNFWLRATGVSQDVFPWEKEQERGGKGKENKASVWYPLYKRTFSLETQRRQQELLYWRCDKWLYFQPPFLLLLSFIGVLPCLLFTLCLLLPFLFVAVWRAPLSHLAPRWQVSPHRNHQSSASLHELGIDWSYIHTYISPFTLRLPKTKHEEI